MPVDHSPLKGNSASPLRWLFILENRFYPLHRYVRPDEIRTVTRLKPSQPRGPLSDPIRAGEGVSVVDASACAGAAGGIALRIAARSPPPHQRMPVPPARRHRRTRPRCGVSMIQKGADRLINHRFTHFQDLLPSTASRPHQKSRHAAGVCVRLGRARRWRRR
jgi:hypothetical protein